MAVRIQFRRDTAANWTSFNPLIAQGEMGLEYDTGLFKVGNGLDNWIDLPYSSGPAGPTGPAGADSTVPGPQGETGPAGPAGADGADGAPGIDGSDGASAYDVAVANGFVGTVTEWLDALVGAPGADGTNGTDGADGASAYAVAVANGFIGTEAAWLASLIGPQGPQGETGIAGPAGADGADGAPGVDGTNGTNGIDGTNGLSAYEIAVANGFVGTEAAWLASLEGAQGIQGETGPAGADGLPGADGADGATGPAGADGLPGADGADGATGATGPAGPGVATGGTAGQILSKIDATDYNTQWIDNFSAQVKHLAKNETGVTIVKGSAVYVSGANGTNMLISLADADTEPTSSKTMGIVEADILQGGYGYVITEGLLAGLNTIGATAGQSIWLSTVAGQFVYGAPPAKPAHGVYLGVVTRVQSNNGEIFVKVQNGYELEELHNVVIDTPTAGQVVRRNDDNTLWENHTLVAGDIGAVDASTVAQPSGVASLDFYGKLPVAQLPGLAITNTWVFATEAEMLAVTAETGDVVIRTDISKSFILAAEPATTLSNWKEILTPGGAGGVISVDSRTGNVTLSDLYAARYSATIEPANTTDPALTLKMTAGQAGNPLVVRDTLNAASFLVTTTGNVQANGNMIPLGGVKIGASVTYTNGQRWLGIQNAVSVPGTNPTAGVIVFADGGRLKIRDDRGVNELAIASTRATASVSTGSLAAGATWTGTITMAKSYRLMSVTLSSVGRARVYTTADARTADASRPAGTAPAWNAGVVLDFVGVTGSLSGPLSPQIDGSNFEASPSTSIPVSITNTAASAADITLTFTFMATEI